MPVQVAATLWSDVLDHLRSSSSPVFRDWFYDLVAGDLEHGRLDIQPLNRHQAEYLKGNCIGPLSEAAQLVTGRLVTVRVLEPDATAAPQSQHPPESVFDPGFTFRRFYGCPENQLALGAALAVSESPGGPHNPLLIIGPRGAGKSHLLQAIGQRAALDDQRFNFRYRTAAAFVAEYMAALEIGAEDRFRDEYVRLDGLLLDDVEDLSGRELSQEALFHIFVSLLDSGRQIVLAASGVPQEIAELAPRLASRFSSGLVAPLETLCLESRLTLLRKLSADRGLPLDEGAVAIVAKRTETPGELVSALQAMIAAGAIHGGPIAADFARRVLDERPGLPVEALLHIASSRLSLAGESLTNKRKSRALRTARELAMHLVQRHTALSLPEIAALFDITAAELVDVLRRVSDEVSRDVKLRELLDEIVAEAKNAAY